MLPAFLVRAEQMFLQGILQLPRIGMGIGVVWFTLGRRWLGEAGLHPVLAASPEEERSQKRMLVWGGVALVTVLGVVGGGTNTNSVVQVGTLLVSGNGILDEGIYDITNLEISGQPQVTHSTVNVASTLQVVDASWELRQGTVRLRKTCQGSLDSPTPGGWLASLLGGDRVAELAVVELTDGRGAGNGPARRELRGLARSQQIGHGAGDLRMASGMPLTRRLGITLVNSDPGPSVIRSAR